MKKIGKEISRCISNYQQNIDFYLYDVPIQTLCLPKNINKILIDNNILRVNQLRSADLGKIKGLGDKKLGIILSRLSEFTFM